MAQVKITLKSFENSRVLQSSFSMVNVNQDWLLEAATLLRCKFVPFPFPYLGFQLGINSRVMAWKVVVDKIKPHPSSKRGLDSPRISKRNGVFIARV